MPTPEEPFNPFSILNSLGDMLKPEVKQKIEAVGTIFTALQTLDLRTTNQIKEMVEAPFREQPAPTAPVTPKSPPTPERSAAPTPSAAPSPAIWPVALKDRRGVVSINGWEHEFFGGGDIVIVGRKVIIDGRVIEVDLSPDNDIVEVKVLEGRVNNIITASARVSANVVDGNLTTKGDASVGAVSGNVSTGGDFSGTSVGGNASVGGDATLERVGGNISAGGNLTIK